jgi:signal transduction histidine kinase
MYPNETGIYTSVLGGLTVLVIILVFFLITIIRYHRRKAALSHEKIKSDFEYLDTERERIAIDLHDDLGALLSTVKIRLQCLRDLSEPNAKEIQYCEHLIDTIMQKLRNISFNMMPRVLLRKGLNQALQELIEVMTFSTNITVNYINNITVLNKEMSVHIYRIVQEILNNTVKYSKAPMLNFTLSKIKNNIELHIADNGIGFNKDVEIKKPGRLGLHTITARAALLKAKVHLTTKPGEGVDYFIKIPDV